MQLIFKVYGVETVSIQKKKELTPKAKQTSKVEATEKKKDLGTKDAKTYSDLTTTDSKSTVSSALPKTDKDPLGKEGTVQKPKKAGAEGQKKETMKHGGSKINNKINERDLKNPKEKDCIIY